jgi:hypothetical protein
MAQTAAIQPEKPVGPNDLPPTVAADGDSLPGQGVRKLDPDIEAALLELRQKFEGTVDGNRARREYVKKCLKLLEFFRGNQYTWWDYTTGSWRSTSSQTGGQIANTPTGTSQALYVMNFSQGFLLSLIALLSGNKMTIRAFPEDPNNADDVMAAEKATLVMKIHQKSERQFDQIRKEVFALCICGTYVSYIRTVTDGERWGYLDEPVTQDQTQQIGMPRWKCVVCGDDLNVATPAPPDPMTGQPAVDPTTGQPQQPTPPTACEQCGAPLGPTPDVPPGELALPTHVTTTKVPRAKTVRTIIDGFEVKLPFEAAEQSEFEMVVRSREVPKSLPRATWPDVADKIGGGINTSEATSGSTQEFERRVRRQAAMGTTTENRTVVTDDRERVTLTECWYRPRAFYNHDEASTRKKLLAQFPEGIKVTWADDTFCELKVEPMDKHLRVCHALPGRSQVREPIMGALIPIQEMANDITNIIRDVIEYTLPVTFVSSRYLDVRKWGRSQVMAGATYNVTDIGKPIAEGFYQTSPGQLPEFATQFLQQLRTEIAQFVTGAFPAAYGGGTPGNNTAQGIEIERQSALGRVNLFLQALQEHYADCAPLIVEDFINNAIEPISFVDENEGGELTLSTVKPEDFDIGRYRPQFEVVSEYPSTWAQRQALMLQLFQMPALQGWVGLLKNLTKVQAVLGLDITAPKQDAYKREFQIINQVLAGTPQPGQPQPAPPDPMTGMSPIDPTTGQPQMVPGPPACSVPVYPLDDNATMLEACADFYFSTDGGKAMLKGGPGWQNFTIHVQERQAAMAPPPGAPPQPSAGAPAPAM